MLERLDVLAQRRRIRVAFVAAFHFAEVRLLRRVGPSVLEPIGRVRVRLGASVDRTNVRLLAGVGTSVDLEVFGA